MKKYSFFTFDTLIIVLTALMLGMTLGYNMPSKFSISLRTTLHKIYIKLHPDSQKDTKTIIMEKATQDITNVPQNNIFEEPPEKENSIIIYIKKIFCKKTDETPKSIHDVILH